jgi:hypothetical protein
MTGSNVAAGQDDVRHHKPKDYEVGYGRPPIEHRFKPGNNANPKGRGKKTRNRKVVMRELFFEPVTVNEAGEVKQLPALEVVLKRVLTQALKGDFRAALTVIGMAQREGFLTPEQEEAVEALSDTDAAILQDLMNRMRQTPTPATGTTDTAATRAGEDGARTNAI